MHQHPVMTPFLDAFLAHFHVDSSLIVCTFSSRGAMLANGPSAMRWSTTSLWAHENFQAIPAAAGQKEATTWCTEGEVYLHMVHLLV